MITIGFGCKEIADCTCHDVSALRPASALDYAATYIIPTTNYPNRILVKQHSHADLINNTTFSSPPIQYPLIVYLS